MFGKLISHLASEETRDLETHGAFSELEADLLTCFGPRTLSELAKQRASEDATYDVTNDWNEALTEAAPEEAAQAYYDYAMFDHAKRNPLWLKGIAEASRTPQFNLTAFKFPDCLRSGTLAKRKLIFTHAQAVEIIEASIEERHGDVRSILSTQLTRSPFALCRNLAKAIEQHDAVLAGKLRDATRNSKGVKLLIEKLCPLEAARDKPANTGNARQDNMFNAMAELRFAMFRRPGLWATVKDAQAEPWPEFNHQLFAYFAEVRSMLDAGKEAAQAGEDITDWLRDVEGLLAKVKNNLGKLSAGDIIPRTLKDVGATCPPGQKLEAMSPYWSKPDPEWQRDMFDGQGNPNIPAIEYAEARMLENFENTLQVVRDSMPKGGAAGVTSILMPPESATRPSKSWLKTVKQALKREQLAGVLEDLTEFEPFNALQTGIDNIIGGDRERDYTYWLAETQKWQGMIWAAHLAGRPAGPVLYDLARRCYAKQPHVGIINEKLGNAAVISLAAIENGEGITFLTRLQARTPQPKIRKLISRELERAAKAAGISRHELEEMSVEDHGLADGSLSMAVGAGRAVLTVEYPKTVVSWEGANGKPSKSPPKDLKESDPDGVRKARALAKEISADLVTQKNRLERLFLSDVAWDYETWRTRYADHRIMAILARSLLWTVEQGGNSQIVLPVDGGCMALCGDAVCCDEAMVRLWHPLESAPDVVRAWRLALMERGIIQPFRQVWRETFTATDAERETATYSNRFAGHILHQHQMMALAHSNGWQCTHRVGFDVASDEPSHIRLPDFGLQAEYWTAAAGQDGPTSPGGAYLYIVTDRLKFHRLDEKAKYGRGEEVELSNVPLRVFSEILRACDLFVSVSSIGLDPEWQDKGGDAEHPSNWRQEADRYWNWSQGAPLAVSANVRRDMLEQLLPRLKNGGAFKLEASHLRVTGKMHDYLIHLGSGGVQIADSRRHVCIVPSSGRKRALVLPFEEDTVLTAILSKAFLLADDDKITDPGILGQIRAK